MTSNRLLAWANCVFVCSMCVRAVCLRLRVNRRTHGVRVPVHLLHPDTWG